MNVRRPTDDEGNGSGSTSAYTLTRIGWIGLLVSGAGGIIGGIAETPWLWAGGGAVSFAGLVIAFANTRPEKHSTGRRQPR